MTKKMENKKGRNKKKVVSWSSAQEAATLGVYWGGNNNMGRAKPSSNIVETLAVLNNQTRDGDA